MMTWLWPRRQDRCFGTACMRDPQTDDEFRLAAADCLKAAKATTDPVARITLLAMAQKWLDLSNKRDAKDQLDKILEAFNEQQMAAKK